jgi:hypothetical protein
VNRRTFLGVAVPTGFAAVALAAKQDRLSGVVKTVYLDQKTIEMHLRTSPNQIRKIMYDDSTSFTMDGKPAKPEDTKEGLRIVALGKFEGVNLKASQVALYNK